MTLTEILVAGSFIVGGLWFDISKHSDDHSVGVKEAAAWSTFWIGLSFVFAGYVWFTRDLTSANLFITGYVLEKALAVDNLFVFMAVFASFGIAGAEHSGIRHRILYWGIIGAIVLRLIFISLGTWVAGLHEMVLVGFAAIILWTVWLMWSADEEEDVDYTTHWATNIAKKVWPVYPYIDIHKFFVTNPPALRTEYQGGIKTFVTPLFLCLLVIEASDILFAFDSVPTIIAVVQDPYLVFTASIFAVLGLRSMYFLLDAAKEFLVHLETAVMVILVFIAGKILLEAFNVYHITPNHSLAVVGTVLSLGIAASFVWPEKEDG